MQRVLVIITLKCEACLTYQRLNAEEVSLRTYTLELALVTLGNATYVGFARITLETNG